MKNVVNTPSLPRITQGSRIPSPPATNRPRSGAARQSRGQSSTRRPMNGVNGDTKPSSNNFMVGRIVFSSLYLSVNLCDTNVVCLLCRRFNLSWEQCSVTISVWKCLIQCPVCWTWQLLIIFFRSLLLGLIQILGVWKLKILLYSTFEMTIIKNTNVFRLLFLILENILFMKWKSSGCIDAWPTFDQSVQIWLYEEA